MALRLGHERHEKTYGIHLRNSWLHKRVLKLHLKVSDAFISMIN